MEIILIALAVVWLFIAYKEVASYYMEDVFVGLIVWFIYGILPLVAIWGIYRLIIYLL